MSNEQIKQEIMEMAQTVKEGQFNIINKHYGEQDLYSFSEEQVVFYCNPYHGEVWKIIGCLEAIEGIAGIHVSFTSEKDEDYDMVTIDLREE